MPSLARARWQRFGLNAARYAIGPLGGFVVPWIVLRLSALETWGEAMGIILPMQVFSHVASWGSRELLLRTFATEPADPVGRTVQNLLYRAVIFLPMLFILVVLGSTTWQVAALWGATVFIINSFEALCIWRKQFKLLFTMDATGLFMQCGFLLLHQTPTIGTIMLSLLVNAACRLAILAFALGPQLPAWRAVFSGGIAVRKHFTEALPFFLIGFSGLLASRIDLYTANALLAPADIGRYQIIASLFVQCQALAALVVLPLSRDLLKLNVESVARYARRSRLWAALGVIPLCAVAWALFRYGFGFRLAWHTMAAAALMVWPVFAYVPYINTLYKHGRERIVMWSNLAAASTSCVLTALLLPSIGPTGGLLAAAAGQWLMLASITSAIRSVHAVPGM